MTEEISDIEYKKQLINNKEIFKVDFDENLEIFSYKNCGNDSSEFIKRCRSTVFRGDKVISQGMVFTPEFTENNIDQIFSASFGGAPQSGAPKHSSGHYLAEPSPPVGLPSIGQTPFGPFPMDQCIFNKSYEGFLIRIFYSCEKWYVTTNKRLNAFKSFWSSRESFGNIFVNALKAGVGFDQELKDRINETDDILNNFLNCLFKNCQYNFIVSNTNENRIVCDAPPIHTVYHISTFEQAAHIEAASPPLAAGSSRSPLSEVYNRQIEVDSENSYIGIPSPEKLTFKSIDELQKYVFNIDIRNYQGVICKTKDRFNGLQCKIMNSMYKKLVEVRGNEASLPFRYLQLRRENNFTDINYFFKLYPSVIPKINEIENKIKITCQYMYELYISRYIKKINSEKLPPEQYIFLKNCHYDYINTRNYVRKSTIFDKINSISAVSLNKLLKTIN